MDHFINIFSSTAPEKAMVPHSSIFAWKIPWTEEPGRLQSMGSRRVGQIERLHFHFSLSCTGEGNGNPLQCSCLENPRDGGAIWFLFFYLLMWCITLIDFRILKILASLQ